MQTHEKPMKTNANRWSNEPTDQQASTDQRINEYYSQTNEDQLNLCSANAPETR